VEAVHQEGGVMSASQTKVHPIFLSVADWDTQFFGMDASLVCKSNDG
jgi:hypothetical protein